MTIYAFGGEMGFFLPADSTATEYTGNISSGIKSYDSGFSRCDCEANGAGSYLDSVTFTALAAGYAHFKLGHEYFPGGSDTCFALLDGFGVEAIRLVYTRATTSLALQYWDGSAYQTVGSITIDLTVAGHDMDLHFLVNSAAGALALYVAGTQRISGASINLSGTASVTKARVDAAGFGPHVSQVVIADESTIGMRVGTVVMTGQGTTHAFDTGGFANIDELIYSDADFIQSGTAAQVELFTGTPIPDFSGYTIRALALTARAKTSGAAPTKFRFALRSAGTTYFSGSDITLDVGYGAFCYVWETNPATAAAFLSSEIAALQYGLKSIT